MAAVVVLANQIVRGRSRSYQKIVTDITKAGSDNDEAIDPAWTLEAPCHGGSVFISVTTATLAGGTPAVAFTLDPVEGVVAGGTLIAATTITSSGRTNKHAFDALTVKGADWAFGPGLLLPRVAVTGMSGGSGSWVAKITAVFLLWD